MRRSSSLSFLLAALLGIGLVGLAFAVPRRNFPIGIAVSPRADLALVGNEERAGEVLALPDLKLIRVLEAEKGSYARWHPREPRVALFSSHLWIYSTDPWRLVHHSVAAFADVVFHGDRSTLIGLQKSGQFGDAVEWSLMQVGLDPNPQMTTFVIQDQKPNRILYAGHDRVVVLGSDGACSLWDLTTRTPLATVSFEGMRGPLAVDITTKTINTNQKQTWVGWVSQDTGKAGIFSIPDLQPIQAFEAHKRGYAEALRFSPDGEQLLTSAGFPEATLKLWDTDTAALLGKKTGMQVLDMAWSPDQKTLYLCDRRNEAPRPLATAELLAQP